MQTLADFLNSDGPSLALLVLGLIGLIGRRFASERWKLPATIAMCIGFGGFLLGFILNWDSVVAGFRDALAE